jgi:hypothetical protein
MHCSAVGPVVASKTPSRGERSGAAAPRCAARAHGNRGQQSVRQTAARPRDFTGACAYARIKTGIAPNDCPARLHRKLPETPMGTGRQARRGGAVLPRRRVRVGRPRRRPPPEVKNPHAAVCGDGGENGDAAPCNVVDLSVVGYELGVHHAALGGGGGVGSGVVGGWVGGAARGTSQL